MEGLMFDVVAQWVAYAISALACFWAWDKMFFWITQKDLKSMLRIFGAALLFTPAPLEVGGGDFAPAFIVIIFRTFLENDTSIFDAVLCMLAALCIGLLLMALLSLFGFIRNKFFSRG